MGLTNHKGIISRTHGRNNNIILRNKLKGISSPKPTRRMVVVLELLILQLKTFLMWRGSGRERCMLR
jgi:hypothetical protein